MLINKGSLRSCGAALGLAVLSACAHEVAFDADYVPEETPPFIAQGKLLVVMPEEQRQFVYEGPPTSRVGDFTTLTVPLGAIIEDIAGRVFTACFAEGVEFVETLADRDDYVVAIQGDMQSFTYAYTRVLDRAFSEDEDEALVWTTPEVEISFHVQAFDGDGARILERTYASGVRSGESYIVTNRPAERVNETLHATLHELMLRLANDIRPLLVGQCEVTDLDA